MRFNRITHPKQPGVRPEQGQAMVEFALTIGIFVLLFFGLIGMAMVFFGWLSTANAAREGARYVITNPKKDDAAVKAYVCSVSTGLGMSTSNCTSYLASGDLKITIEPSLSVRDSRGTLVTVMVEYHVPVPSLRASFFNGGGITFLGPITVTNTSNMRVE